MDTHVPTLSVDGWATTPSDKLNSLFNYFIIMDEDRTFFFKNRVTSFKHIVSRYNNTSELLAELENNLKILLERYFTTVEVLVKKVVSDEHFSYAFQITVKDQNDNGYNLASNVTENAVFEDVIKVIKDN